MQDAEIGIEFDSLSKPAEPPRISGQIEHSQANLEAVARALAERQIREYATSMSEDWYLKKVEEIWSRRLDQATVAINALNKLAA